MNLTPSTYQILYDSKNITKDISNHLLSISYTDKVAGEADEIEIELEDVDALWQNTWYPKLGATLAAEMSNNERVLPCGSFYLDEIEFKAQKGSGDTVLIRGLAAFFNKKLRTKRSTAHENKSLGEIARTVALRHGLTVQGIIPNVVIGRVTQKHKGDLKFLSDLAAEYGYIFSVRNKVMVFTDVATLEKGNTVLTIDKSDCLSVIIKDKTSETYKRANVSFHNPANKELVEYGSNDADGIESSDTLEIRTKAENPAQAERKSKAALHLANSKHIDGTIEMEGSPLLVSGVNFELTGCGLLSGLYHITESTHTITRSDGYKTSCTIKKVGAVAPAKYISTKAKKAKLVEVRPQPVIITKKLNSDNVGFNFVQE